MTLEGRFTRSRRQSGQVLVVFALFLPVLLAFSGAVIGIGNWYVHGRNLQTKADAGALAGGGEYQFPCGGQIDNRIAATARLYAQSNNPQVGGVPDAKIHTVLNGTDWYDDDSNPFPTEFNSPSGSVCNALSLDVKVTEDNSFPLASLLPLFPDIKRRAKVELFEAPETGGTQLLPIAVRAPVPTPAAVYYDESSGDILDVKYFVRDDAITGLPASLQGWTTDNSEDGSPWARFTPGSRTGVLIALSFRGACNTNLPDPNTKIQTQSAPCFEDEFATVAQLCNQGANEIVNCYYATGSHPSAAPQAGLQFIRGYTDLSPNQGTGPFSDPPAVESSWLENINCSGTAYFTAVPGAATNCQAQLNVSVDVGDLLGEYGPPGPTGNEPLHAQDIEVRFKLARGSGSTQCDFGSNCDLTSSGTGPTLTYSTQGSGSSPHLALNANTRENAVAIQIRLKNVANSTNANCRGGGFSNNCRWFYTGAGVFGTSTAPNNAQILASPVQRAFRGNTVNSASVRWLRLTTDQSCDGSADFIDGEAASQPSSGNQCFLMDMGLKGGLAVDADEPAILFDDGTGASQTGTLDCDPNVPQGQALRDSIEFGCGPRYARHTFDFAPPLCPQQNNIFAQPNPGGSWSNWPPLQCVKTRPTGNPNQMETGFERRFFGGGSSCPPDGPGFVKGRNYWDQDNNPLNNRLYGYKDDGPPARDTFFNPGDPRIVTIFLVPSAAFTGSGQDTYPIAGFVQVYVTGYGRVQNGGNLTIDDPCPGSTPPPQAELDCQGSACGYVVWGHFLNWVIPSPNANPGQNPVRCNPGGSTEPCVAVLVE